MSKLHVVSTSITRVYVFNVKEKVNSVAFSRFKWIKVSLENSVEFSRLNSFLKTFNGHIYQIVLRFWVGK